MNTVGCAGNGTPVVLDTVWKRARKSETRPRMAERQTDETKEARGEDKNVDWPQIESRPFITRGLDPFVRLFLRSSLPSPQGSSVLRAKIETVYPCIRRYLFVDHARHPWARESVSRNLVSCWAYSYWFRIGVYENRSALSRVGVSFF